MKSDISVEAEVGVSISEAFEEVVDVDDLLRRVKRIGDAMRVIRAGIEMYDGIKDPFKKLPADMWR